MPELADSETPEYLGRAVAALAADGDVLRYTGQVRLARRALRMLTSFAASKLCDGGVLPRVPNAVTGLPCRAAWGCWCGASSALCTRL